MVTHVCEELKISQRRACQVIEQPKTTQRYVPDILEEEELLISQVVELATQYGRYGYRRITAMLRQEGWKVNHKRV